MSKVFIVNNTNHDYESAKVHGELVSITVGKVPIFKTDEMIDSIVTCLRSFTGNDYILISGPAWLSILATLAVFSRYNVVKFLIFDAKKQEYVVRHLSSKSLKE